MNSFRYMRCGGARSSLSVIVVPSRQVRAIKSPVTLLSRHFSSPKPHSHAAHKSAEHASVPSKRDMSRSNNIVAAGLVVWVATIYYYSIQKIKGSNELDDIIEMETNGSKNSEKSQKIQESPSKK